MNFTDALMILDKHEPETAKRIRETLAELEKEDIFANTGGHERLYRGQLKKTIADASVEMAKSIAQREYVEAMRRQSEVVNLSAN